MPCEEERKLNVVNMPNWEDLLPILTETCPCKEDLERLKEYRIIYNEMVEILEIWMERHDVCCICRRDDEEE